jgi:hypothetical protein
MNADLKQECIDDLTTALSRSSRWRLRKDATWPGDARNTAAAVLLETLAADTANLSERDWCLLYPHFGAASATWRDAVSLASRQVGFVRYPRSIDAFVRNVAGILNESVAAA